MEPDVSRRVRWRKALRRAGFFVSAAASVRGAEGVLNLHGKKVRVVILDIALLNARGMDLASRLEALDSAQGVLYIPRSCNSIVVDAIRQVRPDAVLPPPFSSRQLVARVRRLAA